MQAARPALQPNKDGYIEIHVNRLYPVDAIRHWNLYEVFNASTSGQYDSGNFPSLVKEIESQITKVEQSQKTPFTKIVFINTRQDTHFELNRIPVSLKRIDKQDDLNGKKGEEVIKHEREVAARYLGKKVEFLTKDELEEKQGTEEKIETKEGAKKAPEKTCEPKKEKLQRFIEKQQTIENFAHIKDFVEDPLWKNRHVFVRFAMSEHGPLTDIQVEEFMDLLKVMKAQNAWLHANSIAGGGPATLLVVMKAIYENASRASLEDIINSNDKAKNLMEKPKADDKNGEAKIKRNEFIRAFYTFAKTSEPNQKWSEWKANTNSQANG